MTSKTARITEETAKNIKKIQNYFHETWQADIPAAQIIQGAIKEYAKDIGLITEEGNQEKEEQKNG